MLNKKGVTLMEISHATDAFVESEKPHHATDAFVESEKPHALVRSFILTYLRSLLI
jgi:hypothetical protein